MKNKKQTATKQCMMIPSKNVKCLNPCFWSSSKKNYSSTEMSLLCNKGIKILLVRILK